VAACPRAACVLCAVQSETHSALHTTHIESLFLGCLDHGLVTILTALSRFKDPVIEVSNIVFEAPFIIFDFIWYYIWKYVYYVGVQLPSFTLCLCVYVCVCVCSVVYCSISGGRKFFRENYIHTTKNNFIRIWTITEIMAGKILKYGSS